MTLAIINVLFVYDYQTMKCNIYIKAYGDTVTYIPRGCKKRRLFGAAVFTNKSENYKKTRNHRRKGSLLQRHISSVAFRGP